MSLNLFGRTYESVGSSNSDFLIKTKGLVKIQYGSKFIDLIKDGKINVESKFIYLQNKLGTKDGIYVIGNDVILLISGKSITLSDSGVSYVSFLENQESTPLDKHNALQNIGFLCSSLDDNKLENGIIYVESEKKLYIVINGIVNEYTANIPNPYPELFTISKNNNEKGALVILGETIDNSLAFNSLYIYLLGGESYINSNDTLNVIIKNSIRTQITSNNIISNIPISTNTIQSLNANSENGFRLYESDGKSTLEVDNLMVRNKSELTNNIYPKYWYKENNVITSVSNITDSDQIELTLLYTNKFKVNDSLYIEKESILIPLKVESLKNNNTICISLQKDKISEEDLNTISYSDFNYLVIFLVGSEEEISILRRNSESIDLLKSTSFDDELNLAKVSTRIGNIQELGLKGKESLLEVTIEGTGIYSNNACFLKAQYTSNYSLPKDDKSTKFASTEWVNNLVGSGGLSDISLPKGSIIMFSGLLSEIPEGWHICDGTEGTPNLIGKFIKASTESGTEGGSSEIQILEENLPKHTHTFVDSTIETQEAGEHTHTVSGVYNSTSSIGSKLGFMSGTDSITTSSSGVHKHTINTTNILLSYSGEGKVLNFEPSYYSLIYIMKIV